MREHGHRAILVVASRSWPSTIQRTPSSSPAAARGDEAAWNELVERFSRYVYAICTQAFRLAAHDAEDVFQEVFARVYEHLDRLRNDDAIRPWIAQLTRRLCIDRLRAGAARGPADGEELEPPQASTRRSPSSTRR